MAPDGGYIMVPAGCLVDLAAAVVSGSLRVPAWRAAIAAYEVAHARTAPRVPAARAWVRPTIARREIAALAAARPADVRAGLEAAMRAYGAHWSPVWGRDPQRGVPVPRRLLRVVVRDIAGAAQVVAITAALVRGARLIRGARVVSSGIIPVRRVADATGMSERSIRRAIAALIRADHLRRMPTPSWVVRRYGHRYVVPAAGDATIEGSIERIRRVHVLSARRARKLHDLSAPQTSGPPHRGGITSGPATARAGGACFEAGAAARNGTGRTVSDPGRHAEAPRHGDMASTGAMAPVDAKMLLARVLAAMPEPQYAVGAGTALPVGLAAVQAEDRLRSRRAGEVDRPWEKYLADVPACEPASALSASAAAGASAGGEISAETEPVPRTAGRRQRLRLADDADRDQRPWEKYLRDPQPAPEPAPTPTDAPPPDPSPAPDDPEENDGEEYVHDLEDVLDVPRERLLSDGGGALRTGGPRMYASQADPDAARREALRAQLACLLGGKPARGGP